ncbi:hypothetical protein CBS101457_005425 [Exobasidium rhododendri]|nr:hypothetical protein CBS101457_005425 [Exobasidium rhododendri]
MPQTFSCSYLKCQYTCGKSSHLQRHVKSHTKERDFQCTFCLAAFSRNDTLTRHLSSQHDAVAGAHRLRALSSNTQEQLYPNNSSLGNNQVASNQVSDRTRINERAASSDKLLVDTNARFLESSSGNRPGEALTSEHDTVPRLSDVQNSLIPAPAINDSPCIDTSIATEPLFDLEQSEFDGDTQTSPSALSDALWDLFCNKVSDVVFGEEILGPPYKFLAQASQREDLPADFGFPGTHEDGRNSDDHINLQSRESLGQGQHASTSEERPYSPLDRTRAIVSRAHTPPSTQAHTPNRRLAASNPFVSPKDTARTLQSMKSDLRAFMLQIQPPKRGPSATMTEQCIWSCQRHFLQMCPFLPLQLLLPRCSQRPALLMNLIALGSLWQTTAQDIEKGEEMWHFVLGTNWCNGWGMFETDEATAYTMSLLYTGHSFVMMTSNLRIHKIGCAAWLYAHSFAFGTAWQTPSQNCRDVTLDLLHLMTDDQVLTTWRNWHRNEEKLRVALSLAILEGQQRQVFPQQNRFQDLIMRSPESAPEHLFQASSASEWKARFSTEIPRRNLGHLMRQLFTPHRPLIQHNRAHESDSLPLQPLSMSALLEGINSACHSETCDESRVSGLWEFQLDKERSKARLDEIDHKALHALANWASCWLNGSLITLSDEMQSTLPKDTLGLEMRWHAVHLNIFARHVEVLEPLVKLRRTSSALPAYKFTPSARAEGQALLRKDLKQWTSSSSGRRAMFHAGRLISDFVQVPRNRSLSVGVIQGVLDAAILLTCLVVNTINDEGEGNNKARAIELIPPIHCCHHWTQLGYAGIEEQASSLNSDAQTTTLTKDWICEGKKTTSPANPALTGCPSSRNTECSVMRETRQWIKYGRSECALIMGTPIRQASFAMQEVVGLAKAADFRWCYAKDCIEILEQALRHKIEQLEVHQ